MIARHTTQPADVRLKIDPVSLRRQLRFAFAHAFAVLQELIQNARRAGATHVRIDYDDDTRMLTVTDDGCGIADFQTLLTFAASGWGDEIAVAEQPYGMGFLSSLYASTKVEITSRGQRLVFDTAGLLADEAFAIDAAPEHCEGTCIVLHGVCLPDNGAAISRIARGYALPIIFNGHDQPRPDAFDCGDFVASEVGRVRLGRVYGARRTVCYLQGFRVFEPEQAWMHDNVVHLDPTRYRGVFPDRDRCIDEQEMVKAVEDTIKRLYTERLLARKAALPAAEFCRKGYDLARSLDRLDVFNDVEAIPGEWLSTITEAPRCTHHDHDLSLESGKGDLQRLSIESGEVPLLDLHVSDGVDAIEDSGDDGRTELLWLYAYASGACVLSVSLQDDHWLFEAARRATRDASVETTVLREGQVPCHRAIEAGGAGVQLCTHARIRCDGREAEVWQAFAARLAGVTTFVVPCDVDAKGTITPAVIDWDTLRQVASYIDENDDLDEQALEIDAQEANQAVRALLAETPAAHLQMLLDVALRDYRTELMRFSAVTLAVDGAGGVTVTTVEQAEPAAA